MCTSRSFFSNTLPPLFVLILVICSYYTYAVHFCIFFLVSTLKKIVYLAVYHLILIMFTWSFAQTMWCRHVPVPEEYRLGSNEHFRLVSYNEYEADLILKKMLVLRRLEIYTCSPNGRIRYCKTCMLIKPDRTHHCSTCEMCILKMDHHCPWVSNCVGFSNYKQFLLLLLYATIWCIFVVGTIAEYVIEIWRDFQNSVTKAVVGFGFIVAALSGLLVGILFFYHVNLVCRNETTIEALRDMYFRDDNVTFDVGKWHNFTEVFGENICCWLVPVQSSRGNGCEFRTNNIIT